MSLFIKVDVGFYTHPKTLRLFSMIGEAAFWVPPRLWAFAAKERIDGNFQSYGADGIAMLIGYSKDAQALLQALIKCGFMDENPLRIHDWAEHNGFHAVFSKRAQKAATERWKKERSKEKTKSTENMSTETSIATSMLEASNAEKEAELIYQEYPRKVGKPAALKAIRTAMHNFDPAYLRKITADYAKAVQGSDMLIPNPSTWFNQQRFQDEPSTWVYKNGHGTDTPRPSDIRAALEVKKTRALELQRRHYSDTQSLCGGNYLPAGWRDENARSEFVALKNEIRALENKIGNLNIKNNGHA